MKRFVLYLIIGLVCLLISCSKSGINEEQSGNEAAKSELESHSNVYIPVDSLEGQESYSVRNPPQEDVTASKVSDVSPLVDNNAICYIEDHSWERTEKAEYVMLHFTSAVVPHPEDPFNLDYVREIFEDSFVSIHYIIDRDGKIYCWLPESRAAWHAGKGTFNNDEKLTNSMNKYSIGIEMLAIGSEKDMAQYLTSKQYASLDDSFKGFTDKQYDSLKLLVSDICDRNDIQFDRDHIIGHDMYNPSKNDPGELFDWNRIFDK